jgi:hypothetical protein
MHGNARGFESHLVAGPGEPDCTLFASAVGADSYGQK